MTIDCVTARNYCLQIAPNLASNLRDPGFYLVFAALLASAFAFAFPLFVLMPAVSRNVARLVSYVANNVRDVVLTFVDHLYPFLPFPSRRLFLCLCPLLVVSLDLQTGDSCDRVLFQTTSREKKKSYIHPSPT